MSEALPENWATKKLDDLGFVGRGKSRHRPRNDESLYGGAYPFVQTGDVKAAEFYLYEFSQSYNDKGLAQSKLWDPDTLCITIAANIADTAILKIKACFPDSVVGFVADPQKADVRFVKYYIDTIKLRMQNISKGTTQDNLSLDKLMTFDFVVPPLKIQHKITNILSVYDDLIANNTRRIKILEEMAQTIYREWFVNFRFPGYEKVKMVDSPLGKIPEGWKVVDLGDIAQEVRRGIDPTNVDPETPYVGLEHIPRKSITLNNWGFAKEIQSTKLAFQKGEILFGKIRPYFHKVSIAPLDGVCSSDTIVITAKNTEYKGVVLGCVSSVEFVSHATQTSQGTKMPRANWKVLVKYPVALPTHPLLAQFNAFMANVVKQARTLMFKNRNLRQTRDLLLPKLIAGAIDVSEFPE